MGNWSELQSDMLGVIAQHLDKIEDYVTFGAVCSSWRKPAARKNFKGLPLWQQIPCLMLSPEGEKDVDREFYSLMEGGVVAKLSLPKLKGKKCFESLGWLLTVGQRGEMSLLNPFLEWESGGVEILLPHQNTFPDYERYETDPYIFVEKMVLSARPYDAETRTWISDFVVMLICGSVGFLAFWRPNDQSWNRIETRNSVYDDVVYHKGQFYAIDHRGNVVVCDVSGPNPTEARIIFRCRREGRKELYIVESSQSLRLVRRDNNPAFEDDEDNALEYPVYSTTEFKVYELDSLGGQIEDEQGSLSFSPLKEIKSLGSMALFVGHSASMSLEVINRKLAPHIKSNHIYFTDDCVDGYMHIPGGGGMDMGVCNLETGIIEPLYQVPQRRSTICPSIWVTPNF